MAQPDADDQLQRLLDALMEAEEGLTELAQRIGYRGLEPSEARSLSAKRRAQVAQLSLSEPAYAFVRGLWDRELLDLLAEQAKLDPASPGSAFPYQIPVVPDPVRQPLGWQLDAALGIPQPAAAARLLLWFAVAFEPREFGADWLFAQRLVALLPWAQGSSGRIHPTRRPRRWLRESAKTLVAAYRQHVTNAPRPIAGEDSERSDWAFSTEPSAGSRFRHGPLEGPLTGLAQWMAMDSRTLKRHNGKSWWIKRVHGRRFSLWHSSQTVYAKANQRRLDESARNGA